jgi:hypothetical protein
MDLTLTIDYIGLRRSTLPAQRLKLTSYNLLRHTHIVPYFKHPPIHLGDTFSLPPTHHLPIGADVMQANASNPAHSNSFFR